MKTITPSWPVFVLAADQSRLSVYAPEIELKLLGNMATVEIAWSASSDRCVLRWNVVNFVSSGINSPPSTKIGGSCL
jgi:hypothetical protein